MNRISDRRMIWLTHAPSPPPSPVSKVVSLFQYSCVPSVEPNDGRRGGVWEESNHTTTRMPGPLLIIQYSPPPWPLVPHPRNHTIFVFLFWIPLVRSNCPQLLQSCPLFMNFTNHVFLFWTPPVMSNYPKPNQSCPIFMNLYNHVLFMNLSNHVFLFWTQSERSHVQVSYRKPNKSSPLFMNLSKNVFLFWTKPVMSSCAELWTPPESIRSKTMWSSIFKVQLVFLSNYYF